jgi:hypothetical protein
MVMESMDLSLLAWDYANSVDGDRGMATALSCVRRFSDASSARRFESTTTLRRRVTWAALRGRRHV